MSSSPSPSRSPSPSLSPRRSHAHEDKRASASRSRSPSASDSDDAAIRRRRAARRSRGSRRRRKGADSSPSPSLSPSRSRSPKANRRQRRSGKGSDSDSDASLTPPPNSRRTRSSSRSPSPPPRSPSPSSAARRRRPARAVPAVAAVAAAPARTRSPDVTTKAAPRTLGPNSVPRSLLSEPTLSLHPPLFRLRFSLRLAQTCADILALRRRSDLQRLILDLLLSECAATGRGSDAIPPSRIELVLLRRVEERNRPQPAAGYTLFSNTPGASTSSSLISMAPTPTGPASNAVWYATVVILFESESEAEFVVARLHGLNTNVQGYGVSVDCRLLSSSESAHELRRRWELHYFPTLLDSAARVGGTFGPSSFQMTLAFQGMPAGQRPDTIVLKFVPLSWVDGSLLTSRGRQRTRAALTATTAPASTGSARKSVPRLRYYGSMEEDEGASLSASDVDSDADDKEESGPSWRRLLLLIKRQLELLLQPAAKLAKLPVDRVNVRRWEYRVLDTARNAAYRRRPPPNAQLGAPATSPPDGMPADISDDMIRFPLLNPFAGRADADADADIAAEEEQKSSESGVVAASAPSPMVPLCDVYLMLDDYPTMLACFDYLHNKRMQNRLDTEAELEAAEEEKEEGEAEEGEATSSSSTTVSAGRIIDFGIDVDREGYLRFDNIEQRRQMMQEECERAQAAAQLAAHTARKKKEEAMRLEREAALRRQEEETERIEMMARAKREAEQREAERLHAAAEARAREEARAHREALDSIDRARRLEEKQRQAQRRAEQRAEEAAARGQVDTLQARMDAEEAALLAEELRAEEERAVRRLQLEALRRRRGEEEDGLTLSPTSRRPPPPPLPPQVIDLNDPSYSEHSIRAMTPAAVGVLELWFQQNIERPFPSDSAMLQLARNTGLGVAQVRDWFAQARKTDWKMSTSTTATSAPIIVATVRQSSSNNNAAADQMPGLLSARDEATDSMARRVAAAQAAQSAFKMTVKGRPKVQTDEEAMLAGADGFVRVVNENGEIVQTAVESLPAPSPPPLPSPPSEASFAASTPQRSPDHYKRSSDYRSAREPTPMTPSIVAAAAAVAARPQLLDKVASAVAAFEAKLKKVDSGTTSPPVVPVSAPMDVTTEGANALPGLADAVPAVSDEADSSKKRSRSRSGSRSRSRSRSPSGKKHKKRHRSSSRSKKSSRRHRSRSRDRDFDMAAAMPFFPFPPPFGFPPFGFPPFGMPHMMPMAAEQQQAAVSERSSGRSGGSRSSRASIGGSAAAGQPQPLLPSMPAMPPHMPPHMAHHFAQMAMAGRMGGYPPPTAGMGEHSRGESEQEKYSQHEHAPNPMHPDRVAALDASASPSEGESSKRKSSSSRRKSSKHKSKRESTTTHHDAHNNADVDHSRWRGGEGF